jgi:CubicO group peptidase (beta-lactamase class C family)
MRCLSALAAVLALGACASRGESWLRQRALAAAPHAEDSSASFSEGTPESVGLDPAILADLGAWVLHHEDLPIFSLLISRDGKLVFELYTSRLDRDDAHYVMSVTKSVTSCLVGIAIDRGLVRDADVSVADALPATLFPSPAARARFATVTLRDVLAMSALDAPVWPHEHTSDARARLDEFLAASNRVRFALAEPLLPSPGRSFQYTDVTPLLAIGAVEYAAHESGFDFAREVLFDPLAFRGEEWMHSDASGTDNGAYGLRLRPIDMQKLGVLYLHHGEWNGRQVVSRAWVEQSFTPWIRSRSSMPAPNYGWYWWAQRFGSWGAHVANGWKGQRIAVFSETRLVVTMTGALEKDEDAVFSEVIERFVVPATGDAPRARSLDAEARLAATLHDVNAHAMRVNAAVEPRMLPSHEAKQRRRPFEQ